MGKFCKGFVMKNFRLLLCFLLLVNFIHAQDGNAKINGQVVPFMIDECGDTLLLVSLEGVSVSSFRQFANQDEYNRYRKYRRYAATVYPYAVEAIKIFRQLEQETQEMKKKQRKKYTKELHQQLKDEFTEPLKKLTKTQGLILIKMIEKELDTPLYYLIKELRNGLTARYWTTIGGFFGHKLKDGYTAGEDPILDAVLNDMDISYSPTKR